MRKIFGTFVVVLVMSGLARAESITIATFADPAVDETTPLFEFDATTHQLSGGWSAPGLTLETATGTYENVTFSMPPLAVDGFGEVDAGELLFRDSGGALLFRIAFGSAHLNLIGFGATEFLSTDEVEFTGPILPGPVTEEEFSFAFANQTPSGPGGSFTVTASFTSSAVPEPGSVALLLSSGLLVWFGGGRRSWSDRRRAA